MAKTVASVDIRTATVDPPAINAGYSGTVNVTLNGVSTSDYVYAIPPADLEDGLIPIGVVVASVNTVTVKLYNATANQINGASKTWTFVVIRKALDQVYPKP